MNVTYLLGAGASYDALPIVNQIEERLLRFSKLLEPSGIDEINSSAFFQPNSGNISNKYLSTFKFKSDDFIQKYNLIKKVHSEIIWLYNESKNQSSIDTLAKKLYLQKDYKNLKKLKVIMSCFFYYCQIEKFDKRYDSFFASILEELNSLPDNIRIVSWNYDSQFEIAFKEFSKGTISSATNTLNIQLNSINYENSFKSDAFSIFKLNGTTGEKNNLFINDFDCTQVKMINEILEIHELEVYRSFEPSMSFAWENNNKNDVFFGNLHKSLMNTDLLVVIGYSFPFFNRKIDQNILDYMPELKKVYVQDPKNSDGIIQKIKNLIPNKRVYFNGADRPVEYIPITYSDQFYIPIEF